MRPESCPGLGRRLAAAKPEGLEFQLLARALVGAGTEAAQAALAWVVEDSVDDWAKESRIVPALVGLMQPSELIVACIEKLSATATSEGLRDMSTMVMGALGRQLSLQASPRSKPVFRILLAKLASCRTANDERTVLLALGNTGDQEVMSAAGPYLKSSNSSIRSAAVTALRWVPDRRRSKIICSTLVRDGSAEVRVAAAEALSNVPPTDATVATLRSALTGDQVSSVRAAALESIWLARSKYPSVLISVRNVAKHDQSEDVRKAATRLLERANSPRHGGR